MLVNYLNFFIAIFGFLVTLASYLGPGLILQHMNYQNRYLDWMLISNMVYLLAVAVEAVCTGRPGLIINLILNIAVFLQYFLLYFLMNLVICYFAVLIRNKGTIKFNLRPFLYVYAVTYFLLFINLFNKMYYYIGSDNYYYRGKLFVLSQIMGILSQLLIIIVYFCYSDHFQNQDRSTLLPITILPAVAELLQIFSHGLNFMIIATTICCLSVSFAGLFFWNIAYLNRRNELEQMRVSVRSGMLWTDFLYNTLNDISQLCKSDPLTASEHIDCFADYLRKTMNDLSEVRLFPFSNELFYLKNYLTLEQMRFGDDLVINYDIEALDFRIPSQVLQQTAQCMLRYVMAETENEFCMTMHTEETDEGYIIEFYDDAYGSDFRERHPGDEELLDIENIRKRLNLIPGSKLVCESSPETGNMFKICLSADQSQLDEEDMAD